MSGAEEIARLRAELEHERKRSRRWKALAKGYHDWLRERGYMPRWIREPRR